MRCAGLDFRSMPARTIATLLSRPRRALAALLGVLVLQLSLTGAGSACARDAIAATPAAGHEHHATHDDAGARPGSEHAPDSGDDASRHASTHCVTATSCVVVGVAESDATAAGIADASVSRAAMRDDALPPSVGHAPEPPPPRA